MSSRVHFKKTLARLIPFQSSNWRFDLEALSPSLLSFAHFVHCLRPTLAIRKLGKFIACENAPSDPERTREAINEREKRPCLFHSHPSIHFSPIDIPILLLLADLEKGKKGRKEGRREISTTRKPGKGIFFLAGRGETITISSNISKGLDNYQRAAIPPCSRRGSIQTHDVWRVEKKKNFTIVSWTR